MIGKEENNMASNTTHMSDEEYQEYLKIYNSQYGSNHSLSNEEKPTVVHNTNGYENLDGTDNADQDNVSATKATWDSIRKSNRAAYKAFGLPPQFNRFADPQYLKEIGVRLGRVYGSTYMTNPTIISLKPCGVKYNLIGSGKTKYDEYFANSIKGIVAKSGSQSLIQLVEDTFFKDDSLASSTLYTTTSRVDEYIRAVNYNLRLLSVYMGISRYVVPGSESLPEGQGATYGTFNWMNYQATRFASNGFQDHPAGYGDQPLASLVSAIGDIKFDPDPTSHEDWFHFYCDTGTNSDETISLSTTASMIENALNEGQLNELARNLNFLTGSEVSGTDAHDLLSGDGMDADIMQLIEETRDQAGGWISKLLKGATGYLKGARIAFPKIIEDCEYGKSLDVTCRFISPYGDKESIYLYTYVPLMHILPFIVPGQYDGFAYSFPYICKVCIPGFFNSELAVLTNLSIKRGGDEDMQWTAENLATELTVSFTVTPLMTTLMLSHTANPIDALKNYSLMEYLSNLGGIDITDPELNFDMRVDTWRVIFGSWMSDFTRYFGAYREIAARGNMSALEKRLIKGFADILSSAKKNEAEKATSSSINQMSTQYFSR